jgi:hypothetical protein
MSADLSFWQPMTQLLMTNSLIIDHPKGSLHPRCPYLTYPLDYGDLETTTSRDGGGIDVWLGSLNTTRNYGRVKTLTGILCTFDTLTKYCTDNHVAAQLTTISNRLEFEWRCGKLDAEIKLLIECSEEDIRVIRDFHKEMYVLYIPNPAVVNDLSN